MTARSRNSPRASAAEPDTAPELHARALRLLARREHSREELARKLSPHAESLQALQALLDLLASKRHLSDERYAEARVRQLARKYGAARIRHDLRAKGVPEGLIERLGAGDDLERAKAILARRYRSPAASLPELAKRTRFLLARGFSREVARRALGKFEED